MDRDALGNTTDLKVEPKKQKHIGLNDLPIEIFILIFANVSPLDLKDLRLVCHKWNDAVLDRATWTKAFDSRLGTGKIFASATRSSIWILEYFGRMASLRRWAKAKPFSRLYQVFNDRRIDQVEADFSNDRLLMFSQIGGSVTLCILSLGKNQVFVPRSDIYGNITAFDMSWNYSCVANASGGLFLKNLITATATGYSQSSVRRLTQYEYPTLAVKVNRSPDKHKEKCDIVSISQDGCLSMWNIADGLVASLDLRDSTLDLRTDFKTAIIVVSKASLHLIDFQKSSVIASVEHGCQLFSQPVSFEVDFHDSNIVLCDQGLFRVFHFEGNSFNVLQGSVPENVLILRGTMQTSGHPRNKDIAGGDGLLYALTFSDGSVGVCNIRDLEGTVPFKTRIIPFQDDRVPQGLEAFTMVALNSTVIAIGAVAGFVHFYDAHSGKYLRESTKVSRKFTRYGRETILKIQLGPTGACGVIVSDYSIQYFRYGDESVTTKKPNAPQAADLNNRRALSQHIKSQIADYDEQEYQKLQLDLLADKYNGIKYDDEQDELRVALALSASCAGAGTNGGDDLAKALELLKQSSDVHLPANDEDEDDEDLREALKLSEMERHLAIHCAVTGNEGLSRFQELSSPLRSSMDDSEDELVRQVLERSMIEH